MQPVGRKTRTIGVLLAVSVAANFLFHFAGLTVFDWTDGQDPTGSCVMPDLGIETCRALLERAGAQFELILGMAVVLIFAVGIIGIVMVREVFWLLRFGKARMALTGSSLAILVLFPWVIGHSLWVYVGEGPQAFSGMRGAALPGPGLLFVFTVLLAAVLVLSVAFLGDPKAMKNIMKEIKRRRHGA
ncbi:hypothetical protein [Pseudophaeobacter sp.]|uniref:hypothetical protein n=1 Tax=Pseudophaeobacter sp. TaxID=1971739 RepID=UPI0032970846